MNQNKKFEKTNILNGLLSTRNYWFKRIITGIVRWIRRGAKCFTIHDEFRHRKYVLE